MLLLESYVDSRPIGMAHYINQISQVLGHVVSGDELKAELEKIYSRPAHRATPEELTDLIGRAEDGLNAYATGNFTLAISNLQRALNGLSQESGSLIRDPKLRELRRESLFKLAEAQLRSKSVHGKDVAKSTMEEIVRSYSDVSSFPDTQYPPSVAELGYLVLNEKKTHAGSLKIKVNPSRIVFLNEQRIGPAPCVLNNLIPGQYRVLIAADSPTEYARVRTVDVQAGAVTSLEIDPSIDEHLETEEYIGFRFQNEIDRNQLETVLGCELAKALGLSEALIISGQRSPSSEAELFAAIYNAQDGHREWGVVLPLTPSAPSEQALQQFALSLKTRKEVGRIKAVKADGEKKQTEPQLALERMTLKQIIPTSPPRRLPSWPGYIAGGLGLGSIAWGAAFIAIDGRQGCSLMAPHTQCPSLYDTRGSGIALATIGSTLVVSSAIWIIVNTIRIKRFGSYYHK